MNQSIAELADQKHGGHFATREQDADNRVKNVLTSRLNRLLCFRCEIPDEPHGSDLFEVLDLLAGLEDIDYVVKKQARS